jgi:hypothetical protein
MSGICPECGKKGTPIYEKGKLIGYVFDKKHNPNCILVKQGKEIANYLNKILGGE